MGAYTLANVSCKLFNVQSKMGGRNITHHKSQKTILLWADETNLIDVWRHLNTDARKYTWFRKNPTIVSCRLDFFLISFGLLGLITKADINHGYKTDHSAILIHLQVDHSTRCPGYWKLNCSLLLEIGYKKIIQQCIQDTIAFNQNEETDALLLWDTIKMNIRGYTIKYASSKTKTRNLLITTLEKKINDLENQFIMTNDHTILLRIDTLKKELESEVKYKTQGSIIRSRTQWYEEGEKSSKYFLNLEKRNFNNKRINKLQLEDNSMITNDKDILNEEKLFYSNLYTKKNISTPSVNFFDPAEPNLEILTQLEKQDSDVEITDMEILKAIEDTNNDKSPGLDGLPIEFYKIFWPEIKEYFMNFVTLANNKGELGLSQRQGIISLLPKKGKNNLFLKNWRPLSLLNQDYKIIAKVIATRIKRVLPKIIHRDQTGFLSERYIGENINRLLNIIDYTEKQNIKAILIFIDFEKAFDSIDWQFIIKTLEYFNFGNKIIHWVKILYTNVSAMVQNNGWLSESFNLSRGVRQGCPLSPYLFTLCVELLVM